jgi:hypothetical protein
LAVVIDISYSTYRESFGGSIGDVNGDGKSNTILDAELKAILDLLDVIAAEPDLNNDSVDIGIIIFDTEAQYKGQYVTNGHYKPLDSAGNVNPTLVSQLKSIRSAGSSSEVSRKNWGYTNFDDALDKAIDYFEDPEVDTDRTNVMLFLSDGVPNVRGDGDNEPYCKEYGCSDAPANKPDLPGTDPWESGALSFCTRMDDGCRSHEYNGCVRGGDNCEDSIAVTSYDSELSRLDDFDVYRVAIGVGGGSETGVGSALYKIDNNVMKDQGYEPPKFLTTDTLSRALKTLCVPTRPPSWTRAPSTPAPIGLAAPSETSEPTESPVSYPPIETCTDDITLIKQIGGTSCGKPLTLRERNKNKVTFTVSNTWTEELDHMYIQYYGLDRNEHCWRKDQVSKTETFTLTAYCWENVPITVVSIWVTDPGALNASTDTAEVPECCGGPDADPNPAALYTFVIECVCIPPS